MSAKPVTKEPEPVLHTVAFEIPNAKIGSAEIRRAIEDMKSTLRAASDGVGLAAPQIGLPLKIFLVSDEANYIGKETRAESIERRERRGESREKKIWDQHVYINPAIHKRSRTKIGMVEGCLSIPGAFGEVMRSEKVELSWQDEEGKKHRRGFTGFYARVIQHEMDHLDGFLIRDRVKKLVSLETLRRGKQDAKI